MDLAENMLLLNFFFTPLSGSIFILIVIIALYISVIDPVKTAVGLGIISSTALSTPEVVYQVQDMLAQNLIPGEQMVHTFNMVAMTQKENFIPGSIISLSSTTTLGGMPVRLWAFVLLFVGFLIKLPEWKGQ